MNMTNTAPAISTPAVEAFFARVNPVRSRLIFALDATASRQPTWDTAAQLQAEMFDDRGRNRRPRCSARLLPRLGRMRCFALAVRRQVTRGHHVAHPCARPGTRRSQEC